MFVYRVEHAREGFGPYNFGDGVKSRMYKEWSEELGESLAIKLLNDLACTLWTNNVPSHQISPYEDKNIKVEFNEYIAQHRGASMWYFGFTSMEQLQKWFDDDDVIRILSRLGFGISIYDAPDHKVYASPHQAIFYRPESELMETKILKKS